MISSYYLAQFLALAMGVLTGPFVKAWFGGDKNGLRNR